MSIREEIQTGVKEAMKSGQAERLSTLRMLWSAVRNTEIDKKCELTDEEIQEVVKRQVKQLKDSIVDFQSGGREDLVANTQTEIDLLIRFLPVQMTDEELRLVVDRILHQDGINKENIGQLIGFIMKEVKGKADGTRVREMVTQMLK